MKGKAQWVKLGAQKARHIIGIGEFSGTEQRSCSLAQPLNQRLLNNETSVLSSVILTFRQKERIRELWRNSNVQEPESTLPLQN